MKWKCKNINNKKLTVYLACFCSSQRKSWRRFGPEDSPCPVWRTRFCPERWQKSFIKSTGTNPSSVSWWITCVGEFIIKHDLTELEGFMQNTGKINVVYFSAAARVRWWFWRNRTRWRSGGRPWAPRTPVRRDKRPRGLWEHASLKTCWRTPSTDPPTLNTRTRRYSSSSETSALRAWSSTVLLLLR